MSSNSEIRSVEQRDSEETDPEEEIENDDVHVEVVLSLVQPYADASAEPDMEEENEDADADGLTPTVLEARYERTVPVTSWFV